MSNTLPTNFANALTSEELCHYVSLGLLNAPINIVTSKLTSAITELEACELEKEKTHGEVQILRHRLELIHALAAMLAHTRTTLQKAMDDISTLYDISKPNMTLECSKEISMAHHYHNVMIDLETMSTQKDAAILSIGAVEMNFSTHTLGREFYCNVDLSSCLQRGLHADDSARAWWDKEENTTARLQLVSNKQDLAAALMDLQIWLEKLKSPYDDKETQPVIVPWSNGAAFDIVVLANAFKVTGFDVPWSYRHEMCYRTMRRLFHSIHSEQQGTKHNALEDAKFQAAHLLKIMGSAMVRQTDGSLLFVEQQPTSSYDGDKK